MIVALLMAAAAAAAAAPAPTGDDAETLAQLQGIYAQSCVQRAYGAFDDMCDDISRQIGQYQKRLAREGRPTRAAPPPQPPAAPPGTATPQGAAPDPRLSQPPTARDA